MGAILMELMGHNNLHGGLHISQFVLPGRHGSSKKTSGNFIPYSVPKMQNLLHQHRMPCRRACLSTAKSSAKANQLRCLKKMGHLNLDNRQVFWNMPYDAARLEHL
jgi:hypothetical protein